MQKMFVNFFELCITLTLVNNYIVMNLIKFLFFIIHAI